ncbi:MAG: PQQ-binding-like beta-propeller repeat protein [Fimbriimonas sp.]
MMTGLLLLLGSPPGLARFDVAPVVRADLSNDGELVVGEDRGVYAVSPLKGKVEIRRLTAPLWRTEVPRLPGYDPEAVANDRLLLFYASYAPGALLALDPHTGKRLWSASRPPRRGDDPAVDPGTVAIDGRRAYLLDHGHRTARDLRTGKVRWRHPNPAGWSAHPLGVPAQDATRLYFSLPIRNSGQARRPLALIAIDKETGRMVWRKPLGFEPRNPEGRLPTPVSVGDSLLILRSKAGAKTGDLDELVRLESRTGKELWSRKAPPPSEGSLVSSDGRWVVLGMGSGPGLIVRALRTDRQVGVFPQATFGLLWRGKVFLLNGLDDQELWEFDPRTGTKTRRLDAARTGREARIFVRKNVLYLSNVERASGRKVVRLFRVVGA